MNHKIQEKYEKVGQNIKIASSRAIKIENYPNQFKYQIYDGYRPETLEQTRDYIKFLTQNQDDKNTDDILNDEETPEHMIQYLKGSLNTEIPDYINEKKILNFDQNFESGNRSNDSSLN